MTFKSGRLRMLGGSVNGSGSRVSLHLATQAQWPHVCPHLIDVGEALRLDSGFAHLIPTRGYGATVWPDRILLLMVDHNLEDPLVVVIKHRKNSPGDMFEHVGSSAWSTGPLSGRRGRRISIRADGHVSVRPLEVSCDHEESRRTPKLGYSLGGPAGPAPPVSPPLDSARA